MDYDGSDTQGHNRQLTGEGRSKSSSVPRPYAFPRFDFEDNLQGHLRFENIVESEVFLGIQSHEDDHWIEDFSTGSNVIEFNSSATESCSIAPRNNVWSEATSLESVELLLKSVGQEPIAPRDSVTDFSNTFNELGDLTKKMESKFEHDNVDSEYLGISDANIPQDELLSNISELGSHVEGKLLKVEEISMSQVHIVQNHDNSTQMRVDTLEEKCMESVSEGDVLLGSVSNDKTEQGVHCTVPETVNKTEGSRSSQTPVPVEDANINPSIPGSSILADQVSHDLEGSDNLVRVYSDDSKEQFSSQKMADADTSIMEQSNVNDIMHDDGVPCTLSPNAEHADKGIGAEIIGANESSIMSCTQDTQPQLQEEVGLDKSVTSPTILGENQADVLPSSGMVTDALRANDALTDSSEMHTTKLNRLDAENLSNPEPRIDSVLQLNENSSNVKVSAVTESSNEDRPSGDVTENLSPSNVIAKEDLESRVKITDAYTTDVATSIGFPASSSSVELTMEIGGVENKKNLLDVSPVIVGGSRFRDGCKENFESHESGDVSLVAKKEDSGKLCTDVTDISSANCVAPAHDQTIGLLVSPRHDEAIVNQPQLDILGKKEPENNSIPCKKSNDCAAKEKNEDIHEQSFGREASYADKEEVSGARMSVGAAPSTLSSSTQTRAELDSSREVKFDVPHDSTASQLTDTEQKLIPAMETCNTTSGSESHPVNSIDCSKGLEVLPACDVSLLNKGNVAEGLLSTADPLGAACNSPTTICSDGPTPDERKPEGVGGSEFVSKPSTSEGRKVTDTSRDAQLDNKWTPSPIGTTHKSSAVLEGVATPDVDKMHDTLPPVASGYGPGDYAHGTPKTASGRKRRASGKGAAKENSQSGLNGNDKTPDKPSRKRGKSSNVPLNADSSLPDQYVGLQPRKEQKSKKLSTISATPTSDLPDLNTLALKNQASPSTVYQPSFTDLQQVQLRAQIFVYGSLIQGSAPDEPCMVSAFGPSDRGVWEPVWQAAIERVRSKKSQSMCESPMNSHYTGAKVPGIAAQQVSSQSKVFQSPTSRAGSKANLSTITQPIIPLSSPLWSVSTPYHDVSQLSSHLRRPNLDYQSAVSPSHPYQISSVRNIAGRSPWPSQTICSPGPFPWPSQTPAISASAPFTSTPVSEKMKPSPVKDLSLTAQPSSVKDAPSTPLAAVGVSSTVLVGSSHVPDQTKGSLSTVLPSTDPKPRRKKKSQASNDIPHNSLLSKSQSEPIVASPLPLAAPLPPVSTPCSVVTSMADVSRVFSTPLPQVGRVDVGTSSACAEKTLGKVTDAKLQAEEAAVSAATAINHCQDLWSQLAKQESGISQEAEVKVAAAAGAAAAAACVAKAAAAAARVASNVALQAKLMADEALGSGGVLGGAQDGNVVSNLGSATPASILTCDSGNTQSSSILFAAREAAKKRIEAASAAAKQAENLDAIVKAAELAAEAVSQAGKIVAMGNPLSLKELIKAGPEGYWKLSQASSKLVLGSGNMNKEQISMNNAEGAMIYSEGNRAGPSGVKVNEFTNLGKTLPGELSNFSFDNNAKSVYTISESAGVSEKDLGVVKSHEVSDMIQGNGSGAASVIVQDDHDDLGNVQGNTIMEGSIVEVYKDNDGLKPAWFSANVLKLQDGKAFVRYTSLLSKEGSDNLKEWVALEGEGNNAPKIRSTLPIAGSHWQGTKKRRRSAMGSYTWTVRDKVDVSIQDSWWEGIITEKNEKDDTTLTVHFPARGETSAVSVQQLRPSRIWTNGNWVEWSRSRVQDQGTESDMPLEKRPRLQSPIRSSKGKAEVEPSAGKPEESKLQGLTASEKVFNVGRSTKPGTKPDAQRTVRAGLQKEKSRVVFGVPKPGTGKRQKFMEVSKHYPANQNKKENETKDPAKLAKHLVPWGASAHLRKNPSRVESKEKQAPKAPTSKSRSISTRTVPQKGKTVNEHQKTAASTGEDVEKSDGHEEGISSIAGSSSGTDETADVPLSSLFGNKSDSSVKKSSLSAKTELPNKRKQASSGGQLAKIDEERTTAESGEPRRSNRRFQPTHRLLEGLQSSLVIPKMSSVSSDKVQAPKSRSRGGPSRCIYHT